MNIGIFLGDFNPDLGGSYTFQQSLATSLNTANHNHNFFVFYTGAKGREISSEKVTYVSLSSNAGRVLQFIRRKLYVPKDNKSKIARILQKEINRYKIDMVWFTSHAFEMVDVPYICTVLDLEHRVHPFFPEVSVSGSLWENRERLFSTMIPRAAYVISGTQAGKQQIIDFYHPPPESVRVIQFPISTFTMEQMDLSAVLGKHAINKPYLFYPAQFWPHKNHIVLLHALKLLSDKHHLDMNLVFCGSDKGNLSYVKKAAQDLGIEKNVIFLGFVPSQVLYSLYQGAFALVFPSIFGPDNLPPLEAFANRCPVIAADVVGAGEQLGDAALLVNPLLEDEIVQAVMRLFADPDLRQLLIKKGMARANQFTSHDYIMEIVAICDEFELYRRCWSREKKYVHL